MKSRRVVCVALVLVFAGVAWAKDKAKAGQKIRIAVVGDSLCTNSKLPWPAVLAGNLGDSYEVKIFAANGLTVLNNTYREIWRRYEHVNAQKYRGDITLVCFGANVAKPGNWKRKRDWIALYKRLIGMYKGEGRKIFIVLPPPAVTASPYGISREILHDQTIPTLKQIAKETGCGVIDAHTPLKGRPDVTLDDGLYPTPTGHEIIGRVVYTALTGKKLPAVPVKAKPKPKVEAKATVPAIKKPAVGDVIELTPADVASATGDGPDGKGNTPDDTWGFWFELAHAQGNFMRLNLATAALSAQVRAKGIPRKVWGPIGAYVPNPKDTEGWIFGSDWDGRYEGVWGDKKDNCIIIHPYNEKVYAGKMAITCRLPAGVYAVSAKVTDINVAGGDGISWRVEVANANLRDKLIAASKPFGDKAGPASVTVDVKAVPVKTGQLVRFVIDPNKHWGADMTRITGLKIKRVK